jgi:hypothetical protein
MNNNQLQTPIKYNVNTRNYSNNTNGVYAKTYDRSFHHISKTPYTILDIDKHPEKKIIISSPRSIIALKQCGISVDELYYISFKEFIQRNDALRGMSKEMQLSQYEFFDKHRKAKLNEVITARANIIQDEHKENENDISIYNNKTLSNMHTVSNYNRKAKTPFNVSKSCSDLGCTTTPSSIMNSQLKKYNQLKTKNEIELINLIENEIKTEQMKHKEQQVMLSQLEKACQHQHAKMLKSQEHYIKQQRRYDEKRRKELTDQKIFAKLEIERFNKEQEKLKKEKQDEQMRFKALQLKHKEEAQKDKI